ncbi:type II toxin-antitoxin system prevent-host-death family antitoxin [Synechococcus sp. CCY9201]|uniref:type II toxin-antitoxin system Phd/YefM family antitoxin n=1 Tax=Synechococcus sp. CCY9201 TaxID=174697 RepID=UPI002B1F7962|nr:type II toxin-antitoxin system prevent-host-death family antitoxin [Synechococcus sp. CCY9201]MEA5474644.1 type II toxin-antitoxin system prevent-host-death family antitoxin [Synechococcus sp. CCY9201]
MRTVSVAQVKAQLSALLDAVESGEDVQITRRGVPVALLTRAATTNQPLHKWINAATLLQELREGARY